MVPLEPWQKVYIELTGSQTRFRDVDPVHGLVSCAGCHGGNNIVSALSSSTEDKQAAKALAHEGMIKDPSADPDPATNKCAVCHAAITQRNQHSMHTMLWGERYKVAMRAFGEEGLENHPEIEEKFQGECASCHTTCGQCHISRPNSVEGGLLDGHRFIAIPDMRNNCVACHGSRVGKDYYGYNEGEGFFPNSPDTHKNRGKTCLFCHTEDFHGDGTELADPPRSRYETNGLPQCVDCHADKADVNAYHTTHWPGNQNGRDLSCFVCHSQKYNNCNSCHTAGQWKEGYGEVEGAEFGTHSGGGNYREYPEFRIGYNPAYEDPTGNWSPSLTAHSESKWILVRHIPVVKDSYEPWDAGIGDLLNYNSLETWQYTSPHNIQLWTNRTDTGDGACYENCHTAGMSPAGMGNNLYLWEAFVDSVSNSVSPDLNETNANAHVIVNGHINP